MASQWKSLPRYHCTYCNYWCVDNKINRDNHENSERHKENVERFLSNQKAEKERKAAHEREVERVLKRAEQQAKMKMEGTRERKPSAKKASYYDYDRPPIQVQYDTINQYPSYYNQPGMYPYSMQGYAPVVYNPAVGNIPPPPPLPAGMGAMPVVYDETTGNIPPPPPLPAGMGTMPVVYDETTGNIPPPPPLPSSTPAYPEVEKESHSMDTIFVSTINPPSQPTTIISEKAMDGDNDNNNNNNNNSNSSSIPPPPPPPLPLSEENDHEEEKKEGVESCVKYNFNYEEALTEEDLFGSWKTVSVSTLSANDLQEREAQYEKAIMKSSKDSDKSNTVLKTNNTMKRVKKQAEDYRKTLEQGAEDDEDEMDAMDTYNPFGGGYKGVAISNDEPMYVPEKRTMTTAKSLKTETEEETGKERASTTPAQSTSPSPFMSTPISFSFTPTQSNVAKKQQVGGTTTTTKSSSTLSSFFS